MTNNTPAHPRSALVAAFQHQGRHYEQRLVCCGKKNCTKCFPAGGTASPAHGPYWYLCARHTGRWRRIYLGKDLDTQRFVLPSGGIDWDSITHRRAKGTPADGASDVPPAQPDILDAGRIATRQQEVDQCDSPTPDTPSRCP